MLKRGKQKVQAERVMMQCDKLAARPNLRESGSGRTNVLAAWVGWLLVRGRPKGPCSLRTSETSRSSRGREKEKMLASGWGGKQAKRQEGQCNAKDVLSNAGR